MRLRGERAVLLTPYATSRVRQIATAAQDKLKRHEAMRLASLEP